MRSLPTISRTPRARRIAFKMTILAATTMVIFSFITPYVRSFAYEALEEVGDFEPLPGLEELRDELLVGTTSREELSRRGERIGQRVLPRGAMVVAVDAAGSLVVSSPDLAWRRGEAWPLNFDGRYRLFENQEEIGLAVASWAPVREGLIAGGRIGLIQCSFGTTWDADDSPPGLDLIPGGGLRAAAALQDEDLDAAAQRLRLVRGAIDVAVSIVIALFMAGFVTLIVTRRLRRLARQAARPPSDQSGVPGPFEVAGGDEVAILANTLNGMRTRVIDSIESLEHRDEMRREWIAQVSHDLRTPLTALLACLERARNRLAQGDQKGVDESLGLALHDLSRVRILADDLLEIARLEIDDSLDCEPMLPMELMRQASRGLVPLAEDGGVRLEIEAASDLPEFEADGLRLMRACENLLRNAIRHAHSRVVFGASCRDEAIRFSVRDDGDGFAAEPASYLSEDTRLRPTRGDSAGLGLLVTRKIAEAHGGRIGARNLDDGGAEVWFTVRLK
jgi:signal transduction histidine kinase